MHCLQASLLRVPSPSSSSSIDEWPIEDTSPASKFRLWVRIFVIEIHIKRFYLPFPLRSRKNRDQQHHRQQQQGQWMPTQRARLIIYHCNPDLSADNWCQFACNSRIDLISIWALAARPAHCFPWAHYRTSRVRSASRRRSLSLLNSFGAWSSRGQRRPASQPARLSARPAHRWVGANTRVRSGRLWVAPVERYPVTAGQGRGRTHASRCGSWRIILPP